MRSLRNNILGAAGTGGDPLYVEDVFSTYLYTGNGATQTITNGIDLDGEGGLTWIKGRSATADHQLFDTDRGATKELISNSTATEATDADTLTAFNSDGFALGADSNTNTSSATYTSWTFRKAEKFFDVVTYTGTGAAQSIPHILGSKPGMVVIKRLDTASDWPTSHRRTGTAAYYGMRLNTTAGEWGGNLSGAQDEDNLYPQVWQASGLDTNVSGGSYVAYLFAHDAGGFGADGSESIIKCGTFSTVSNAATIELGWEPQLILTKRTNAISNWDIVDSMRGFTAGVNTVDSFLSANTGDQETSTSVAGPTATGFFSQAATGDYIYIAIRRPMKVPGAGTEVYNAIARTGTGATAQVTGVGFAPDFTIIRERAAIITGEPNVFDRMRGALAGFVTSNASAEGAASTGFTSWEMDGVTLGTAVNGRCNASTRDYINYFFKRAPEFMDVVCYTGNLSAAHNISHNLGVVPTLVIVKCRGQTGNWGVYSASLGANKMLYLEQASAASTNTAHWDNTTPTATQFTVGVSATTNQANTMVAYLFATLAGISKVGTYTGTAASLDLDMGFAAGARFFLCKRTDSTGDWYVYDSGRGIVAGNDPYLLLNSTAAEVTGTDLVDPYSPGLTLTAAGSATININSASYIYLAIA